MDPDYIIIGTLVFVLILGVLAILFAKRGITEKENKRTGKYPEGHYMSLGIAIGMSLGMAVGVALDNIALGPGFGAAIGIAIGAALEQKYKDKLRPLTEEEKEAKKKIIYLLLGALLLGVIVFLAIALF